MTMSPAQPRPRPTEPPSREGRPPATPARRADPTPARKIDTRRRRADELGRPGPARSRALEAMQASLKRDVGLCGDRCAAAAIHALDAALDA